MDRTAPSEPVAERREPTGPVTGATAPTEPETEQHESTEHVPGATVPTEPVTEGTEPTEPVTGAIDSKEPVTGAETASGVVQTGGSTPIAIVIFRILAFRNILVVFKKKRLWFKK